MSDHKAHSTLLASSAVMASGTILSRFSGYFRTLLIIAALGELLHADIFTIANTIPHIDTNTKTKNPQLISPTRSRTNRIH